MWETAARQEIELLSRAHNLYTGRHIVVGPGRVPRQVADHAERLIRLTARHSPGPAADATGALAAGLRHTAAVDTELATQLAAAGSDRELGRRATRTVLDEALADTAPAADTALGRREAQRRTAACLRAQHNRIHRSQRYSHLLARRVAHLAYPHHRSANPARHVPSGLGLALPAVRYTPSFGDGHVRHRIGCALDRLGIGDPAARSNWLHGYETLIARESGGRALAVAAEPATDPGPVQADGHRLGYARGITQTIPATFAGYHQPGTSNNIYDPVANICASMNYVMHRYGVGADGANLAALVQQADPRRRPRGY